MSVNFLYSQTLAPTVLRAFRPFESFVLLHTIDEVPEYDGQ
jgi:hypothetical protein